MIKKIGLLCYVIHHRLAMCLAFIVGVCSASIGMTAPWSGNIAMEYRGFLNPAQFSQQQQKHYFSLSAQPEFYHDWSDGRNKLTFTPFFRKDQSDPERSHFDIRELNWLSVHKNWQLLIGISKVFWGVTESQHLVDIINQTDGVESLDGEAKLGQPMVELALARAWGNLDLYVLPGFRQRTFAGVDGRLRFQPVIDSDQATFEAENGNKHVDFAIRWSHYIGDWDFGLSHFYGTNRQPSFKLAQGADGTDKLITHYALINQTGLDVQTVQGDWLLKLEVISRTSQNEQFSAFATGFEYTLVGLASSVMDLGLISEYLYDDRGELAITPFANDVMMGARITLNDVQSSEILLGYILDLDSYESLFNLEASRRLGRSWKLSIEGRSFSNITNNSVLRSFRDDGYIQLNLAWYF